MNPLQDIFFLSHPDDDNGGGEENHDANYEEKESYDYVLSH